MSLFIPVGSNNVELFPRLLRYSPGPPCSDQCLAASGCSVRCYSPSPSECSQSVHPRGCLGGGETHPITAQESTPKKIPNPPRHSGTGDNSLPDHLTAEKALCRTSPEKLRYFPLARLFCLIGISSDDFRRARAVSISKAPAGRTYELGAQARAHFKRRCIART